MPDKKKKATEGQEAPIKKAKGRSSKAAEIAELKEEVASLKDQLIRAMAENENVRKRLQKELEDTSKYAITGFARDLLDVMDNLYRTKENIPAEALSENEFLQNIFNGVDLTKSELIKTFEKHGITRISPLGEQFDHNFHQAVVQVEDPNAQAGEVVQVIQAGYILKDRLLRPAMVGVAKKQDTA